MKWAVRVGGVAAAARYKIARLRGRPIRRISELADTRVTLEPAGRSVAALKPIVADRHLARVRGGYEGATREQVLASIDVGAYDLGPVELLTIRDAYIVGDTIFTPRLMHLLHRQSKASTYLLGGDVASVGRVAFAGTYAGSRWFGHLLHDEFPAQYELERHAPLVMHHRPVYRHEPGYREVLGLAQPPRYHVLRARELLMLYDINQSVHKTRRYDTMRARVAAAIGGETGRSQSRGLFVLRGAGGSRRVLVNESAVAARLEREGFRVIDPSQMTVRDILTAFASARIICGTEGSHLLPSCLASPTNAIVAPIYPPMRTTNTIPTTAAFFGLNTAMLIAEPAGGSDEEFSLDPEEAARSIEEAEATLARDPNRAEAFTDRVRAMGVG